MPAARRRWRGASCLARTTASTPRTVEDFRRSGLAHLLAVSGQNVILLALLAMPCWRPRHPAARPLLWVLALIAIYVPLTGAGPSIQRAAVMGAPGSPARSRAGRVASVRAPPGRRGTLAIDPAIAADVGWQLSFAAVIGILFWRRRWRRLARPARQPPAGAARSPRAWR